MDRVMKFLVLVFKFGSEQFDDDALVEVKIQVFELGLRHHKPPPRLFLAGAVP